MDFFERFRNKTVTLLGAGVSNTPLAEKLLQCGARLIIRDKKENPLPEEVEKKLRAAGACFVCGESYLDNLDGDWIFRSPGFRPDLEPIQRAVANGSVLTSEMEMFLDNAPCPVIGITGSDGKSTTTTLTAKILERSGFRTFLGGNIGEPLLHRINEMRETDAVAAELSSFQLMTVNTAPQIAAIKNVTPNHLNWHRDMEEYISAKSRILRGCKRAVLNYDDGVCRELGEKLSAGEVFWFSRRPIPENFLSDKYFGVYPRDGVICVWDKTIGKEQPVLSVSDILLPGEHNTENYSTAIAAVWGRAKPEAICETARSFGGVAHRFELVREKDGVRYYNSSIDSSPTRTAAAISSLTCPVNIICGGYDKKIPFEPLAEALISHGHIKTLVLTGATMDKIKAAVTSHPGFEASGIRLECRPDFKEAVLCAAGVSREGDAVLLSPACASFDAFANFEKRGEYFREIVNSL